MASTHGQVKSLLLISLLTAGSVSAQELDIRFAHPYPSEHPIAQLVQIYASNVEAEFDNVVFTIYPNGTLYSSTENLDALRQGAIDMTVVPISALSEIDESFSLFNLPFLFSTQADTTSFFQSDEARMALVSLEGAGLIGIAYWPSDSLVLALGYDKTLEDLDGLHIAAPMGSVDYFSQLGADVKPIESQQVYSALQQGVVDAAAISFAEAPFYKSVADAIVPLGNEHDAYVLTANADFWRSIYEEIKESMTDNALQIGSETTIISGINQNIAAELENSGITIMLPSEEIANVLKETTGSLLEVYSESDPEFVKAIMNYKGTGGGGDPCVLGTCRCSDRTCEANCCPAMTDE